MPAMRASRSSTSELAAAKKQAGEAPVAFERVKALVQAQVDEVRRRRRKVAFKIAMKDGKVSLTVKAEKRLGRVNGDFERANRGREGAWHRVDQEVTRRRGSRCRPADP